MIGDIYVRKAWLPEIASACRCSPSVCPKTPPPPACSIPVHVYVGTPEWAALFSHLKGTISKPGGAAFYANCHIFRELGIQREPSFHKKAVGSWVAAGMTAGLGRV